MDWIKRNLYFVIGSFVALLLLGAAGWYFYSSYKADGESLDKLREQYANLGRLNSAPIQPGKPPQFENVALAREQQQQLRGFQDKAQKTFQRIPGIPEGPKVAGEEFVTSLRHTIDQLQKAATNSSITVPADYGFSFAALRNLMKFQSNSPESLALQLGEVKAICDVLFQAKVNALEYVHRERMVPEDASGTGDYLNQKSVTNDLAILSPYEVKFRCFTPELASTLSGFANSPLGLLVKTINVEPASAVEVAADATTAAPVIPMPIQVAAPATPELPSKNSRADSERMFRQRYGLDRRQMTPTPQPQPVAPAPAPVAKAGLQTVLDERQLAVTLSLNVVKLLPSPSK